MMMMMMTTATTTTPRATSPPKAPLPLSAREPPTFAALCSRSGAEPRRYPRSLAQARAQAQAQIRTLNLKLDFSLRPDSGADQCGREPAERTHRRRCTDWNSTRRGLPPLSPATPLPPSLGGRVRFSGSKAVSRLPSMLLCDWPIGELPQESQVTEMKLADSSCFVRGLKEEQEWRRQSSKDECIYRTLSEDLSDARFPFDWNRKNGVILGGDKVFASELKRCDEKGRIPVRTQPRGIYGFKAKNIHRLFSKESTYATSETLTLSPKMHNGFYTILSPHHKPFAYHDSINGAPYAFIHRLREISGLEADTIRQEKLQKLKKRPEN
ncbi:uncharacterized protein LOC103174568 isoform X2 [Callorhinchus milii]|uniref:uncharacterized protein LOC103174568 isoform X2 n=1 Tax=Callorhinchus milii TaxID=7868 RepID=UPI001C3F7E78|nr:uncharacterized protein LOC103174568 isoform X2 [Callorhinchus milii]